jgi:membrane protein DedA with SNARE-associated domain
VIIVTALAGEAGGLIGYHIGFRWGRQLVQRPGKHRAYRETVLAKGEHAYERFGRLAVFVTPAIVSGTAKMPLRQFALWNFLASVGFTLSVVAGAYGIGRLVTGHYAPKDVSILVIGVCAGLTILVIVRRHRRRSAATAAESSERTDP